MTSNWHQFRTLSQRGNRDTGASAVEYALIVFAIAAVIVAVVFTLGLYVRGLYSNTCSAVAGQVSAPGNPACS